MRPFPMHSPTGPPAASGVEVLVAGAGPVGLLLANLLGRQGRTVMVVERRRTPAQGSMAIGITPPSLAILRCLDLDGEFTQRGIPIRVARVFEDNEFLGDVDFSKLPAEHRFILSLPQTQTIEVLRRSLAAYPCVTILDGVEVRELCETEEVIRVGLRDGRTGADSEMSARFLAGCDGHRSDVRRLAGIAWRGRAYRAKFLMADFADATALGAEAHLYFGRRGSVESFPLPGGRRRWIVQQTAPGEPPERIGDHVARCVRERMGVDLSAAPASFENAFQPSRYLAQTFVRGRVVLCGDAAHVMSPIGGQGMNTGFADAAHLACALAVALDRPARARQAFRGYGATRQRAFRVAANRAARGMWLGTRTGFLPCRFRRALIARVLLRRPVRARLAPYFAMLTIPDDPVVRALRAGSGAAGR